MTVLTHRFFFAAVLYRWQKQALNAFVGSARALVPLFNRLTLKNTNVLPRFSRRRGGRSTVGPEMSPQSPYSTRWAACCSSQEPRDCTPTAGLDFRSSFGCTTLESVAAVAVTTQALSRSPGCRSCGTWRASTFLKASFQQTSS